MENSTNKAVKAGVAYTVGNILLKGISFITLPIFSRLLSTKEFGLFNIYVSYEVILTIFVGMCLYGSLRTGYYDFKDNFNQYVTSALSLSSISFFLVLLFSNIFFPLISSYFEFGRSIMNILICHSYAMFIFQFYNTKVSLEYKYKKYLLVSAFNSIGGTLLSIILIITVCNYERDIGRIYGYAVVPIFVGIVILGGFLKTAVAEKHIFVHIEQWKYGFSISGPLVVHTFSQQILNQFDKIMLNKLVGTVEVGIYSFMHTISNILQVIVQSMDNAWSVWLYEQLDKKAYEEIKQKSNAYIFLMNILFVGFVSIAPDVIRVAGTQDYYIGIRMIIPLALAVYFIFLYSLPVHVEYFYKKTKYIALGTSGAAIINLILNFIFIKLIGYQGVAWTTFMSYFILYIFHWYMAKSIIKRTIFSLNKICLSILLMFAYSSWIFFKIDNWIMRWIGMIGMILILFTVFRKEIRIMLGIFNKQKIGGKESEK